MSVRIEISHALKKYGDKTIIPDLSLSIKEGEFFTLLGPSGCGKTTLLRMIAGFNSIEGGDFNFNNVRINDIDPGKRNIGMVFQNYAIFPHMNVRKNVEFGLKNRKYSKEKMAEETDKILKLIQIDEYADRMPERLSGGQQQRVALARALVIQPDVLLMDEPLSNLDAKLRVEMRNVIKSIQHNVGITTVYVTHDQEEAMAVSDRVAIMNHGVIQHIGTPKAIYQRPANLFVATFIGRSNILDAELVFGSDGKPMLCLKNGSKYEIENLQAGITENQPVLLSARPEEIFIERDGGKGVIGATVEDSTFLGLNTHYFLKLETGETIEVIQESQIESILEVGTKVSLSINMKKINIFTKDGSKNLLQGVQNEAVVKEG